MALPEIAKGITKLRDLADGGRGIRVALLDTGIDMQHPVFNGRNIIYKDCCANHSQPVDIDGHGTHCAGVVLDLVTDCTLFVGRVMERNGNFNYDALLEGLLWCKRESVDVVCICSGAKDSDSDIEQLVQSMVDRTTFVAAIGNSGSRGPDAGFYPAKLPEVFAVGSAGATGVLPFVDLPDHQELFCVGGDLTMGPWPGGSTRSQAGTSVSACQMAGIISLIKSTGKYSPDSLVAHLRKLMTCQRIGSTTVYCVDASTEF